MQTITLYTKKAAAEIAGTLTSTSKMPCKSYSIPAAECVTGSKLAKTPGTICSECYAQKGFYKMYAATIAPAQYKRLESITSPDWVAAMVSLIGRDAYFRWHDSGDLQSLEHLRKIATVAELTPNCKHWLPTRERTTVKQYLKTFGPFPDNLTVRLSAVLFDAASPTFDGLPTSTAHRNGPAIGHACPAPAQAGACKDCRACWDGSVTNVSYAAH